jgi:hypothetical protein
MSKKDAAVIKALEELGLRKKTDSDSLPDSLADLASQLDQYEQELGSLDANTLRQYLIRSENP